MQLRNWEFFDNGNPVVGAAVYVREGGLTHPNISTVLATTATDVNGMWSVTGLTDTPKDVEVVWGATSQYHKWYKGMTRHNVAALVITEGLALSALAPGSAGLLRSNGTVITAGNQLAAGDFPSGVVGTSAIAANAVTQVGFAAAVTTNPTTTSTTIVDMTDMAVTLTTTGGDLLAWFAGAFQNNTVGASQTVALRLDTGSDVADMAIIHRVASTWLPISTFYRFTGVSAASHTVRARWSTTAGTVTNNFTERNLLVMEIKR